VPPDPVTEREEFRRGVGRVLRMLAGGLIVTLVTGGAVATAGLLQVKGITDALQQFGHRAQLKRGTITLAEAGKPQTVLLAGSDHRYGQAAQAANSDTLMLVRLDPTQSAITVLSIPRDLAVQVPGHGLEKINAAYGEGGLDLTTRTIKTLLSTPGHPFRINHAIATTFGGFVAAINQIHCVYVDVDRRYLHSNAGLPVSQHWAEIDIEPGYQELCGTKALQYVRFRHQDNDLVRSARQQGFLRAAKDQLRRTGLVANLKPLVRIFARATETDADLQSSQGLLRLAKLAIYSAGKPVREVHFPATFVAASSPFATPGQSFQPAPGLGDYVTATPAQLHSVVRQFLHPAAPRVLAHRPAGGASTRQAKRRSRQSGPAQYGLVASAQGKALVKAAAVRRATRMPVFVPSWLTPRGTYPPSTPTARNPRRYVLVDGRGNRHAAYRIVVMQDPVLGQYYGVQGTTWKNPPILAGAHQALRVGNRSFDVYTDGGRIRLVAWRTPQAVYWVSNTLTLDLSNRAMLGIARSTVRVGP
jgi:polyisoprenyl-teichoic acid--peptidoglycan teichoic acid transferase